MKLDLKEAVTLNKAGECPYWVYNTGSILYPPFIIFLVGIGSPLPTVVEFNNNLSSDSKACWTSSSEFREVLGILIVPSWFIKYWTCTPEAFICSGG